MDLLEKVTQLEQDAEQFGFRWGNTDQIMDQIKCECVEINEHLNQANIPLNQTELQEEIGDLLHAVFSLCVFCKFEPRETLEKTLLKFERRLNAVKQLAQDSGLPNLEGYAFEELMHFWKKAKQMVG